MSLRSKMRSAKFYQIQKEIYSEEKLKSRRIDEIGLSAFNFASVLYAVEKIEERRGPSPFLTANKKTS